MQLSKSDIFFIKKFIISIGQKTLDINRDELIIDIKNDNSPVTHIDKLVSKQIVEFLSELTPDIQIVSEEEEIPSLLNNTFWLVDPIDGTKSYISHEDTYTINIGLIYKGKPKYGFIYQPPKKLMYYTNESLSLCIECDEQHCIPPTRKDTGKNAVIGSRGISKPLVSFFEENAVFSITSISSSIKLCMIADGSADLYPNFSDTMEWDIAAGHALIIAAGGDIIDINTGLSVQYSKKDFKNNWFIAHRNMIEFKLPIR
jgi:3'(2'), 5'-bisphosphate nucleotidase